MEELNFSIEIKAHKEKVWDALWQDANYREWTSVFSEGSYAKTNNWEKGSKVLFLNQSGDGMSARVVENEPYKTMSFEHLGEIRNGIEDTESEAVKAWAGNRESYFLSETENGTLLKVTLFSRKEFLDFFEKIWPQAMDKIKIIAEK